MRAILSLLVSVAPAALWAAPATRAAVLDRIASPEVAARIDALARTLFPQSGVAA